MKAPLFAFMSALTGLLGHYAFQFPRHMPYECPTAPRRSHINSCGDCFQPTILCSQQDIALKRYIKDTNNYALL